MDQTSETSSASYLALWCRVYLVCFVLLVWVDGAALSLLASAGARWTDLAISGAAMLGASAAMALAISPFAAFAWAMVARLAGRPIVLRAACAEPSPRCLTCAYDLTGLAPGVPCPECGLPREGTPTTAS